MAKREPSFNFGANAKPKKAGGGKKKAGKKGGGKGGKSNAWRAYTSNAPIPP